ncbi:hypothetical protein [Deinococcus saxicola]|uniref:hypothetical protein n=1 Tax=Deinococcus saxicola TaxID=249406 RepID=UPI0039F06D5D
MVRDLKGRFRMQGLLCTDPEISAHDIVNWFPMRWQVEVTFEESRAHLGVETGRGWSAPTLARTMPLLLGLFSIVTLLAQRLWLQGGVEIRASTWYSKTLPTFSYGLRLKGVENTWKSDQSEKEKNGFRTWSVEIGAVPISTRNKRNRYQMPWRQSGGRCGVDRLLRCPRQAGIP